MRKTPTVVYYDVKNIPDETERLKLVLASYNTGHGPVQDARRLPPKYGGSDTVWEDMVYWLPQKTKRTYYTDTVDHILERYAHYQELVTTP